VSRPTRRKRSRRGASVADIEAPTRAAPPTRPLRSPSAGGEGLICPETGNRWPGAWVRAGIQPWLALWDALGAFGHRAATALNTPGGPSFDLRPVHGKVVCRSRLGGMLNFYVREAA
jgi:hypothetical protein